jgi:uncharacterized protein YfeS
VLSFGVGEFVVAEELDPILTSTTNDYGPVGSDTGADALAHYRDWRKHRRKRETFLRRLLRGWELLDEGWDEMNESRIREQLERDPFQRLVGDDTVIAFAFAQLIVDGDIAAADRQRALWAVERQGLPGVLEFRDWTDRQARLQALATMRDALLAAPQPADRSD